MIRFNDFPPGMVDSGGKYERARFQDFNEAVAAANEWVEQNGIKVLNVETVVLPNIWNEGEQGSTDASLVTDGEQASRWHQFVRVWYES